MDAPGATPLDESAVQSTPKHDTTIRTKPTTDMTQGAQDKDQRDNDHNSSSSDDGEEEEEANEEDDSDDEDDEPRLKYAYLTKNLGSVYRNGDATSSFLVAGDKMVYILSGTLYHTVS